MFRALLACALLLTGASGCNTTSRAPTKAAVAWRTHLTLQPVEALQNPPEYTLHLVTLTRKDTKFSWLTQIEIEDNHRLILAGVTHTGLRLFLLQYDHQSLLFESHDLLPAALKGKFMLAELQVIYWPAESLRAGGLTVKEPTPGLRQIYRGSKKIITVRYRNPASPWRSLIEYENHQRGMKLYVEPVNHTP